MRHSFLRPARLAVVATVLATVLAITACGSSSGSGSGSSSGAGASAGGTIGFSIPQGSNPALQALDVGLKAEAQKAGLHVSTTDANLDPNKQISDLQAFIQQKVKAIVVWPLDDLAVQPALKQAEAAHIPIIALYTLSGGPYFTDLILDGQGVGNDSAQWFAQNLGKGANVAAILGPPQVDQFRDIATGFKTGVMQTGLHLLASQIDPQLSPENAVNITQTYKQRFGTKVQGLFVTLESQAVALTSVVDPSFKPKIATYGGTDACINALKSGLLSVCYYQNPTLMGRMAGWAAGKAVAGQKIPTKIYLEVPGISPARAASFPSAQEQLTQPYAFKPVERNGRWTMPLFK